MPVNYISNSRSRFHENSFLIAFIARLMKTSDSPHLVPSSYIVLNYTTVIKMKSMLLQFMPLEKKITSNNVFSSFSMKAGVCFQIKKQAAI